MSKEEAKELLEPIGILQLESMPFSITFKWKDNEYTIQLKNGEDILKIGSMFAKMLSENGIEHTIKTEGGLGESESLKENFNDSSVSNNNVDSNVDRDFMYNWIRKHSNK